MENTETLSVLDSNQNELIAGDSVTIIQSLKVKGANDIKKWTAVKNIRLIHGDPDNVEGRVDGVMMVLKTSVIKKLNKKKKKKK